MVSISQRCTCASISVHYASMDIYRRGSLSSSWVITSLNCLLHSHRRSCICASCLMQVHIFMADAEPPPSRQGLRTDTVGSLIYLSCFARAAMWLRNPSRAAKVCCEGLLALAFS